jgi:hypothetical protein
MADMPWHCAENRDMNCWNEPRNCSGSRVRNNRLKVSWLGTPWFSSQKPRRKDSFSFAAAPCPPRPGHRKAPRTAQSAAARESPMLRSIAVARILQPVPARHQLIQRLSIRRRLGNPSAPATITRPADPSKFHPWSNATSNAIAVARRRLVPFRERRRVPRRPAWRRARKAGLRCRSSSRCDHA